MSATVPTGSPTPPEPPKPTAQPTRADALVHLQLIEEEWKKKYTGLEGHNPFLAIKNKLDPLRLRLKNGDQLAIVEALAMKPEPPVVESKGPKMVSLKEANKASDEQAEKFKSEGKLGAM